MVCCLAALIALAAVPPGVATSPIVWWSSGPFEASYDRFLDPLARVLAGSALGLAAVDLLAAAAGAESLSSQHPWRPFWILAALLALLNVLLAAELLVTACAWLLLSVCLVCLVGASQGWSPGAVGAGAVAWLGTGGAVLAGALLAARTTGSGYRLDDLLASGGSSSWLLLLPAVLCQLGLPPVPWISNRGAASEPLAAWVLVPWPAVYLLLRLSESGERAYWDLLGPAGLAGLALSAWLAWRPSGGGGYPALAMLTASLIALAAAGSGGATFVALAVAVAAAPAGLMLAGAAGLGRLVGLGTFAGLPLLVGLQLYALLDGGSAGAGMAGLGPLVAAAALVAVAGHVAAARGESPARPRIGRFAGALFAVPLIAGGLLPAPLWVGLLSGAPPGRQPGETAVLWALPVVELWSAVAILLAGVVLVSFVRRPGGMRLPRAAGGSAAWPAREARLPAWRLVSGGSAGAGAARLLAFAAMGLLAVPHAAGRALEALSGRYYMLAALLLGLLAIFILAR